MKLSLSNAHKFLILLAAIFFIAFIDYKSFLDKSRKTELFDDLHYNLNSIRVSIVKLEYLLDMFVVTGRSESTTIGLIKGDVDKIDENLTELLNSRRYIDIIKDNDLLSDGFASLFDDWQTTKNEITRLDASMPPDGIMLLHNAVDMNTVLVTEKADRLLSVISESRKRVFSETKRLAHKTLLGFILIIIISAAVYYKNVTSRLNRAAATARRIAGGDLSASFKENKNSSVGRLAAELNLMIKAVTGFQTVKEKKNMELAAALSNRDGQIESINEILAFAGRSLSLGEIYNLAVKECIKWGAADAAAIYINEENSLRLKTSAGFDDMFLKEGSQIPHSEMKGFERNNTLTALKDPEEHPSMNFGWLLKTSGFKSAVCAPITYNMEVTGFLYAAFRENQSFSGDGASFFETLASCVGVSSGHVSMFQKEFNSRRFLERILHQMPHGLAVFDTSGNCLMANTVLKRFLGAEQRFNFTGEYRIFEDDILSSQGMITSIKKSYEGYSTEFIINYNPAAMSKYHFSGPARKLKIKSLPLYDSGGEISNIVLLYEDITDTAEVSA